MYKYFFANIKYKINEMDRWKYFSNEKKIIRKLFKESKELEKPLYIFKLEYTNFSVYHVRTLKKHYIVKSYPIVENTKYLKEQIKYVEALYNNGANVSMPLKINNSYVYETEANYIVVYDYIKYIEGRGLYTEKMDLKKLVDLLVETHKIDKKLDLPCFYRKIPDYKIEALENLVEKNNFYLENIENDLTICHNDFKPLNILWKKRENTPYLIDFDTAQYVYKYANLIEVAINFSYDNKEINFEVMGKIFKYYFQKVEDRGDFEKAFYLALNGKLSWLNHMIETKDASTKILINLLKYVEDSKEKIRDLYLNS